MPARRTVLFALPAAAALIVAGCTSGSDGDDTPQPSATVTDTVTSAAPPTGSGVPASSTPASAGSGGGTGSSGNASGPGLCTPTVMTFAVGKGDGAAGTAYTSIIATNASQQPCVTTGWPGVAVLDAAGHQVGQAARTGDEGSTLTVQPGGKIHAVLSSSDVPSSTNASCPVEPAILFTMPDNTDSTQIKGVSMTACDPKVQSFVAGESG